MRPWITSRAWLLLGLVFWATPGIRAAIVIRFDAPTYQVTPNGSVTLTVVVDSDDEKAGNQPVPNGLFSFGFRLGFDPTKCLIDRSAIVVNPALDYTGLVPGAALEEGPGFILCRGNVAAGSSGGAPFAAVNLLSVKLRNLAPLQSRYALALASAQTNLASQVFLDGTGHSLDDQLTFERAEVAVIPPAALKPPRLVIRLLPPDSIELTYPVAAGLDHFVETSDDLRLWRDLFPVPRNDGRVRLKTTGGTAQFRVRAVAAP